MKRGRAARRIGSAKLYQLAEARDRAWQVRRALADGRDPRTLWEQPTPLLRTFREAAEDDLALLSEPEKALGVAIDPATTIRITPLAGSGVAFATVVDANGDTQFIPAVPSQK